MEASSPGVDEEPDKSRALQGAIAIALVVFVGITSLFAAAMCVGIAPLQLRETGISGGRREPDDIARWATYSLAVFFVINAVVALRNGRKNITIATVCTVLFVVANIVLGYLFVGTW